MAPHTCELRDPCHVVLTHQCRVLSHTQAPMLHHQDYKGPAKHVVKALSECVFSVDVTKSKLWDHVKSVRVPTMEHRWNFVDAPLRYDMNPRHRFKVQFPSVDDLHVMHTWLHVRCGVYELMAVNHVFVCALPVCTTHSPSNPGFAPECVTCCSSRRHTWRSPSPRRGLWPAS